MLNKTHEEFHKIIKDYKEDIEFNRKNVIQFYLMSGRYYYGRNQYKKAKIIFKQGLEYAPEDVDLKKMHQWAIEDSK